MYMIVEVSQYVAVASFSEAWIEMRRVACVCRKLWSPPSRRRGLKFPCKVEDLPDEKVASFSEAWMTKYKAGVN